MTGKDEQLLPIQARITPELMTLVDQVRIAERHDSRASVARAALREYLDKQEDQVSSLRHLNKTMNKRMDRLERQNLQLQANQTAIMILVAQVGTEILTGITGKEDLNGALAVKEAFDVAQIQHGNIQGRSKEMVAMLLQKAQQPSEKEDPPPAKPE
jgi:Arc/MetJ-type ribon-helix-helix transcriptional regulator